MRTAWAVIAGLALGIGAAWWLARESPRQERAQQERARQQRAERAAAANARDARLVLYRWRDRSGVLQVTDQPPSGKDAGRRYERIDTHPRAGIEVRGERD